MTQGSARAMLTRLGRVVGCLMAALTAFGLGGIMPSTANVACPGSTRVFAVDARTGHLTEIRTCPSTKPLGGTSWRFGPVVEVDSADWRTYSKVFGVYDGDAAILYAITPAGELWWRRQDAPGAAPSAAVRVAGEIDWRHDVVFAAPGYLVSGDSRGPVRTFRHHGWAAGGTAVSEDVALFTTFHGPVITAVAPESGYAVGTWEGMNYRVWRLPEQSGATHDDVWYPSGLLPAGVSGVTGDGTHLYGVGSDGVVLLVQWSCTACMLYNNWGWQVAQRVPGHFSRVVVPQGGGSAGPSVAPPPTIHPHLGLICGNGRTQFPWEWQ